MLKAPFKQALWLGAAVYGLSLIATLPAALLSTTLERHGVRATAYTGSIWHGEAHNLQYGVLNLGQLEWRWRALPLLAGRLAADIHLVQADGQAKGRVALTAGGTFIITALTAALPLQQLVGSNGLPGGWSAEAKLDFKELRFEDRWPVRAQGSLQFSQLTGPARSPMQLGSYRLDFPAQGSDAEHLVGTLTDLPDATMTVTGTLTLQPNRSYVLEAHVASNERSPANFAAQLPILGPADGSGRYPLTLSGSF